MYYCQFLHCAFIGTRPLFVARVQVVHLTANLFMVPYGKVEKYFFLIHSAMELSALKVAVMLMLLNPQSNF